jgi:hypothetical protein
MFLSDLCVLCGFFRSSRCILGVPGCVEWVMDGSFDARYLAFLETLTQLRPSLHRSDVVDARRAARVNVG